MGSFVVASLMEYPPFFKERKVKELMEFSYITHVSNFLEPLLSISTACRIKGLYFNN